MAARRPKNKVEVTLYFDSQLQADWFCSYWLDGGGSQQQAQTHEESWGKNWFYMKTSENACPGCGYLAHYFYDQMHAVGDSYQCSNCFRRYTLK